MAKDHIVNRFSEKVLEVKPEKKETVIPLEQKRAQRKPEDKELAFSKEEIQEAIFDLQHYLNDFQIMADSFMMPDIYSYYEEINGKRVINEEKKNNFDLACKNKLRNAWFSYVFPKLRESLIRLGISLDSYEIILGRYKELLTREDAATHQVLRERMKTIDMSDPTNYIQCYKEARRAVVSDFVQEKIAIIDSLDILISTTINTLRKKYESAF